MISDIIHVYRGSNPCEPLAFKSIEIIIQHSIYELMNKQADYQFDRFHDSAWHLCAVEQIQHNFLRVAGAVP